MDMTKKDDARVGRQPESQGRPTASANEPVRLINDETGWTALSEAGPAHAYVAMPVLMSGGFGQIVFVRSGERDAQGRPIFRTREQ